MNIFNLKDYRRIFKTLVEERKKIDDGVNFQKLALAIGSPKSYVSKVLNGTAHFSSDQAFLASQFMGMSSLETRYINTLVLLSRTKIKSHRILLEAEIESFQKEALETKQHLKKQMIEEKSEIFEYYADPIYQIVHMGLLIEKYSREPARLAFELGVSTARISAAIQKLEQLGIVDVSGSKIEVNHQNVHLPRTSRIFKYWRDQSRLFSIHHLQNERDASAYNLAVTFTANEETRKKVRLKLLETIREVEKLVKEAPSEQIYQMNIDLFSWTQN